MITWKVRGRSSSQTPEPASTPIASARTSSIMRSPSSAAGAGASAGAAPRAAERLVGEGDQDQHGGADDEREDAEVEQERGGERAPRRCSGRSSVPRSARSGTDSRRARRPARCAAAQQQAERRSSAADGSRSRASTQRVPPAMYCRMKRDRQRDPGREAAARQVVAAQEAGRARQHDDHREQPAA